MNKQFERTQLIIGEDGIKRLLRSRVAVFGIGGVGGFAVEALARAGIGELDLIDHDTVDITNLNRQIIATHRTIGAYKVDVMKTRISDINPELKVNAYKTFYLPENAGQFPFSSYDYIVDAIDTVTAKVDLAVRARAAGVPIIASMGTGNKMNPSQLEVTTIDKTSVCPLARVMRKALRERGIHDLKVVYSREEPCKQTGSRVPGSISFVPSAAGLILAGEVIKELIRW